MGVFSKTFISDLEVYDTELVLNDVETKREMVEEILEVTEVPTSNLGLVLPVICLIFFGTVFVVGITIIKLCTRNSSGKYAVKSTMTRRFAAKNPVFGSAYSLHPATLDRPTREPREEKVFACKYYKIEGDSIQ